MISFPGLDFFRTASLPILYRTTSRCFRKHLVERLPKIECSTLAPLPLSRKLSMALKHDRTLCELNSLTTYGITGKIVVSTKCSAAFGQEYYQGGPRHRRRHNTTPNANRDPNPNSEPKRATDCCFYGSWRTFKRADASMEIYGNRSTGMEVDGTSMEVVRCLHGSRSNFSWKFPSTSPEASTYVLSCTSREASTSCIYHVDGSI